MNYCQCQDHRHIYFIIIRKNKNVLIFTKLSRMEFPTSVNWTSPFPLDGIFLFYLHFYRTFCKKTVEFHLNLGLHCLHMSQCCYLMNSIAMKEVDRSHC